MGETVKIKQKKDKPVAKTTSAGYEIHEISKGKIKGTNPKVTPIGVNKSVTWLSRNRGIKAIGGRV